MRPRWRLEGGDRDAPAPLAAGTQWRFGGERLFCFALQSPFTRGGKKLFAAFAEGGRILPEQPSKRA
ncbi:hypothetical protein MB02_08215 [Croceicoccus estronivorus]|nr:hypothetical protein MB02_08215 [Croceicoccus estronivorus]